MYNLPNDVVRKIYDYDSTYRVKFNNVVEELDIKALNHKRVDMSLTREDVILFVVTFAIGLYIFIDEYIKNKNLNKVNLFPFYLMTTIIQNEDRS